MVKRAEQLNFLTPDPAGGQIIPTALHAEMQRSYLEYAMSVIVGRALPDARDGLKPVHRRILFAMHELGLLPDRPFRKCARVVGDVLGKYHPHGDQSVYDALVRLVQDFSCRYPLIAGHGNFGSVDNDPPAAMRYTECRLSFISHESMMGEIDRAIIDFTDNFDGSQQEPVVLPAQLPILLLNGAAGIAVGMATNIPPHNLSELVDALAALIDRPDLPDDDLFRLVPAPDFPTGGIIIDDGGVREAYTSGRGSIILRGVASLETVGGKNRRSRQAIIVTELPYQVNKAGWIEKIAELVNQNKMEGIAEIRDESDRTGMRVVLELKRETVPEVLLEQLYRQTALQVNFGAIMLALVGSLPRQMSLRELLQQFLSFREETLTRRLRHELHQAQQRLHLLEGLVIALADLDRLIDLLRAARDTATAKAQLQEVFQLSEAQSDAILAMPLRRITGMEQQNLQTEKGDLERQIEQLQGILGDRRKLLKNLKKDLLQFKKKHGDERRTRIVAVGERPTLTLSDGAANGEAEPETGTLLQPAPAPDLPPEDTILQISYKGYIKRLEVPKNGKVVAPQIGQEDLTVATFASRTDRTLIVLTRQGKAYPVEIADLPPSSKGSRTRGTPLVTLLPEPSEAIVAYFPWDKNPATAESLVVLTTQAKIKRLSLADFAGISGRGLMAVKVKDDERLFWAGRVGTDKQLAIATASGRILRMAADEEQIPLLGRAAAGNQALRLRQAETPIGIVVLDRAAVPGSELILATTQGFIKRLRVEALRLSPRASIGTQAIGFRYKNDFLAAIAIIPPEHAHCTIAIARGNDDLQVRIAQIALEEIPLEACNGNGRSITELGVEMAAGEKVAFLTC